MYFRNPNEEIAIASRTNSDGITWEPWTDGESVGFKAIEVATGREQVVKLTPTDWHDVNPDTGATADVFLYVDNEPVIYINLFEKED